jgi:hypothetical protein
MEDHLRVGSRREYRAIFFQFASFFAGEGKVAVVTYRYLSVLTGNQEWLRFPDRYVAGSRITNMTDRAGPWPVRVSAQSRSN